MRDDLVIQRPEANSGAALLLLFHGVGGSVEDLRALGQALGTRRSHACIVCLRAPDPSDLGQGWQWFSVKGVTETNRVSRVAATMPRFVDAVRAWQRETGIGPAATTLIGFSQGAIMALESTQQREPLAACVIAIAGRFAQPPRLASPQVALHLLHGDQDRVMPPPLAAEAAAQWRALGGQAMLEWFPGLGHAIDARVVQRAAEALGAQMQ